MRSTVKVIHNDVGLPIPKCVETDTNLLNYNPQHEARRILAHIPVNEAQLIVIAGFAFGYLLKEVQQLADPNAKILVIDSDEELIHLSKQQRLIEQFESDERITFVFGDEKYRATNVHAFISQNYMFVHRTLTLNSFYYSNVKRVEYTKTLLKEYSSWRNFLQILIGNDPDDTLMGLDHFTRNIATVVDTVALSQWENSFTGIPAICVASGPSLEQHIELIKKVGDKAVIIAADSIVERLYKEGVKPHIVTIIERNEVLYTRFFKDKYFHPDCVLVGYSSIWPKIFPQFPGKSIAIGRNGIIHERLISEILPSYDAGQLGQSCAHLSFSTAQSLGCDPIILIGQDLAYGKGKVTHASGVNNSEEQELVDKSLNDIETFEVDGYYGGKVLTTLYWKQFKETFESWMLNQDRKYINATEGGAYIKGAEHIPFGQALELYLLAEDKVAQLMQDIVKATSKNTLSDIKNLKDKFKDMLDQINQCEGVVLELEGIEQEIRSALEQNDVELFSLNVTKYTQFISEFETKNVTVSQVSQYPILKYIEKINNLYITTDEDSENWVVYMNDLTSKLKRYVAQTREYLNNGINIVENIIQCKE